MKTHFLFMFLLMISSSIKAQVLPVVTPSPEAAALGSVAKLPVDYHTGQVNIEIPLLEVEQGGFKLPIKLTYNTTGIQINNRTTWVGTNWNLDAGGVITRTVKGNADENGESGFWKKGEKLNDPQWYDIFYLLNKVFYNPNEPFSIEPDEFNFKAPGISGTFYIGNDQKAYVVGQPDMKVELNSHMTSVGDYRIHPSWMEIIITAPDGIRYEFRTTEQSCTIVEGAIGFVSSWLLNRIIFPKDGSKLNFEYSDKLFDIGSCFREIYSVGSYELKSNGLYEYKGGYYENISREYNTSIDHYYLKSITGDNFKLDFIRNQSPQKKCNWSQLKSIILSRNSDNKKIKNIQFEYNSDNPEFRFWLTSVRVFGQQKEDESMPPYRFVYYLYKSLPKEYSNYFSTDHWGFYNGGYHKTIPDMFTDMDNIYYSSERNANPEQLTKGMLKQIIYPTGGSIKLEYEPNDFSMYGETRKTSELKTEKVTKVVNNLSVLTESSKDLGGGLRIKKLTYSDFYDNAVSYQYKYVTKYNPQNEPNINNKNISSGILGSIPVYYHRIDTLMQGVIQKIHNTKASQSFTEESLTHGAIVGYSEVTEIAYDSKNRLNGYTTYKYSNFDSDPDIRPETIKSFVIACIGARTNRSMDRGLLLSKEIHDKNYNLIKKFNYSYSKEHPNNIRAIEITNLGDFAYGTALLAFYVPLDTPILSQETEINYANNGMDSLIKIVKYAYNDKKQIKEVNTQMNDKNTWYSKRFSYPTDFTHSVIYRNMVDINMINSLIQSEQVMIDSNGNISNILKEKYNYDQLTDENGVVRPIISNYQSTKGNAALQTHVIYDYYDKKGNPLHITIDEKEEIIYLWGYNYQYIVAEIKNATMMQVKNIIGNIDDFEKASVPNSTKLNQLRAQLKEAQVRVFEFDPLIGKIRETDAKGVDIHFEYDLQGRLMHTKDYLGNMLEKYLHHYSKRNK